MIAFDTDILSDILRGDPVLARRASSYSIDEQLVPIVVVEEILRGRFNAIRSAEAGQSRLTMDRAYQLFEATLVAFRRFRSLSYTSAAHDQFQAWRAQKIRIGTHDLRIAAICVTHSAMLVTRNKRDFDQVPGLRFEVW